MPEDRDAQYKSLTAGAGFVDLSDRTQIELTGEDRAKFLHSFCTNDILVLAPGEGCEAFLTDVKGRILGYVFVFCGGDSLIMETVPGQTAALIEHLDRYLIREQVLLHDRTDEFGELLLSGQESESLITKLVESHVPKRPLEHVDVRLAGCRVWLRRVPLTGPVSFLIGCPAGDVQSVAHALQDAGAAACGADALETARIEAGSPFYGQDVTSGNFPQEVNRDAPAVNFKKGCYLGQETVARIDALGHVNRKLAGVRFGGERVPAAGTELLVDGKTVGHVTSAAHSPRLEAPLALAYVRRGHNEPGAKLSSPAGNAEVITLPLA